MNIYILGLDHETQRQDGKAPAPQRQEYEKLVRELITTHGITVIGEETYIEEKSTAREVAKSLQVRWEPIEMTRKMREALKIADEQVRKRNVATGDGWNEPIKFVQVRVRSDGIREQYMFWKAVTKAEESNAMNILILCGFQHSSQLQEIFQRDEHKVTLDSLCNYPWYSHPDCV